MDIAQWCQFSLDLRANFAFSAFLHNHRARHTARRPGTGGCSCLESAEVPNVIRTHNQNGKQLMQRPRSAASHAVTAGTAECWPKAHLKTATRRPTYEPGSEGNNKQASNQPNPSKQVAASVNKHRCHLISAQGDVCSHAAPCTEACITTRTDLPATSCLALIRVAASCFAGLLLVLQVCCWLH
eukprot:jgi/Ulvmu1/7945/UM004_0178.1